MRSSHQSRRHCHPRPADLGRADLSHPAFRIIVGLALAALLLGGITRLLMKRYEKGDVYPPYSSLRIDPLGTAAFHDALALQPGVTVRRNTEPLEDMGALSDPATNASSTIMILGIEPHRILDANLMRDAKRLASQGSRVVLAMRPVRETDSSSDASETGSPKNKEKQATKSVPAESPDAEAEDTEDSEAAPILELKPLDADGEAHFATHSLPDVEDSLPWFSLVRFEKVDPAWTTILSVGNVPVGIELRHGAGSILLLGDSYLFSNEALLNDRRPGFLRWCVGGADQIVFEETHHGLFQQDNVMTLIRKYQLAPAVGICLLAALFFLWRNALPFPPRLQTETKDTAVVGGLDAGTGLLNLLRRSVPPRELLAACLAEWRHSLPREATSLRPAQRSALNRLEAETALPPAVQNAASAYNEATRILEKTL